MSKPSTESALKKCKDCDGMRPLSDFHKHKGTRDGRSHVCKACACERTRKWKIANPARAKAADRAIYQRAKDRYKVRAKKWAAENREARRAIARAWDQRNIEHKRAKGREYNKRRDAADIKAARRRWLAAAKLYRERHPEIVRARQQRRKRRKRAASMGVETAYVNYDRIVQRDRMRCHICRKRIESMADLHFDHVIPLAKGGPHVEQNIACAHKFCNQSKSAKVLTLF